MKVKSKNISVYVDENGQEHENHIDAVMADLSILLGKNWGQNMSAEDAAQVVFDGRDQITDLFRSFNKINGQKTPKEASAE